MITNIIHDAVQALFLRTLGGTPDEWEANRDWSSSIEDICFKNTYSDKEKCETANESKISDLERPPKLTLVGFTADAVDAYSPAADSKLPPGSTPAGTPPGDGVSTPPSASSAPATPVKQALKFLVLAAFGLLLA